MLIIATSIALLINYDWRWSIAALGIQYIGAFFLVSLSWPANLAVIKLVAGWMAGSALGMTRIAADVEFEEPRIWPTERLFRILAASMVILVMLSISPRMVSLVPNVEVYQASGGLIMLGLGLLQLGLTTNPLRVTIGLLTVLSGFEILYAAVETSALVAGLLAIINLSLAVVGAYLLSGTEEEVV